MQEPTIEPERVELEAFEDLWDVAPGPLAESLGLHHETLGGATALVLGAVPSPIMNRVIGLGLSEPATEETLDACVALFARHRVPSYFLHATPSARPPDLPRWLTLRGFVPSRRNWTKFVHSRTPPNPVETDLRVALATAGDARAFSELACATFGLPASISPLLAGIVEREGWSVALAFDGERPVACGALFISGSAAWLGFGATLPEYRGRHAQRALLAKRVELALEVGAETIVVETGEAVPGEPQISFQNIVRAGFVPAYSRVNYTRAP